MKLDFTNIFACTLVALESGFCPVNADRDRGNKLTHPTEDDHHEKHHHSGVHSVPIASGSHSFSNGTQETHSMYPHGFDEQELHDTKNDCKLIIAVLDILNGHHTVTIPKEFQNLPPAQQLLIETALKAIPDFNPLGANAKHHETIKHYSHHNKERFTLVVTTFWEYLLKRPELREHQPAIYENIRKMNSCAKRQLKLVPQSVRDKPENKKKMDVLHTAMLEVNQKSPETIGIANLVSNCFQVFYFFAIEPELVKAHLGISHAKHKGIREIPFGDMFKAIAGGIAIVVQALPALLE